jgi:hypothetical protein
MKGEPSYTSSPTLARSLARSLSLTRSCSHTLSLFRSLARSLSPGHCSESVPPRGGEGSLRRLRRSAVEETWAGRGSMPVVFSPGMACHPCPTLRATSLSLSKENRKISERDDLGPPVVPGVQEIGLGSRNLRPRAEARPTGRAVSRERLGDWDGPMEV